MTRACSLSRDHCRVDAVEERGPEELTTAEGQALVDQIAEFDPTPVLVLSAGDPLERPALFEFVGYATEPVPTAVTPAPTDDLGRVTVEGFAELGVRRMVLSLDGATAESHDGLRGEAGSLERVQRAAEWVDDTGLDVRVTTTVTAETVEGLPRIAGHVADLGAATWEVFSLAPTGRGAALEGTSPERAESVLARLYEHSRTAPSRVLTVEAPHSRRVASERAEGETPAGPARAGRGFVFVGHTGAVYPSGFLPVEVGDVRERSVDSRSPTGSPSRPTTPPGLAFPGGSARRNCSRTGSSHGSRRPPRRRQNAPRWTEPT